MIRTALLFVLLDLTAPSFAEDEPRFIVSAEWLARHLNDPNIALLQVGTKEQYDSTHIPGAHFLALSDITMRREDGTVFELAPVSRLDSVFESKGVSDDSRVVVYFGRDWISPTARAYLTLDYLGLGERTFILDGRMGAWVAAGHPVTAERPPERRGSFTPRPRSDVVADVTWLSEHLSDPGITLIDSRNREFYTGEGLGNSVRAGHIPGAWSMPFTELVDDSMHFKSREELTKMFADGGIEEGKTMVSYCHIGQQASLTYFVARYLGFDARLYDGSMNEWSRNPDLPVVTSDD